MKILCLNETYKNVHWTVFEGQEDSTIKIQNDGNYAHAQLLNAYNFCLS